ncbi:MAG: DUF1648 domain-containing protein [Flavobacteriaceae bacterium]
MSNQLTNRLIKIVSYIGLFLLFALPAYFWSDLPEVIPIHYGANGQPDGFGKKSTLWVLAIIAGFFCKMPPTNRHHFWCINPKQLFLRKGLIFLGRSNDLPFVIKKGSYFHLF